MCLPSPVISTGQMIPASRRSRVVNGSELPSSGDIVAAGTLSPPATDCSTWHKTTSWSPAGCTWGSKYTGTQKRLEPESPWNPSRETPSPGALIKRPRHWPGHDKDSQAVSSMVKIGVTWKLDLGGDEEQGSGSSHSTQPRATTEVNPGAIGSGVSSC